MSLKVIQLSLVGSERSEQRREPQIERRGLIFLIIKMDMDISAKRYVNIYCIYVL